MARVVSRRVGGRPPSARELDYGPDYRPCGTRALAPLQSAALALHHRVAPLDRHGAPVRRLGRTGRWRRGAYTRSTWPRRDLHRSHCGLERRAGFDPRTSLAGLWIQRVLAWLARSFRPGLARDRLTVCRRPERCPRPLARLGPDRSSDVPDTDLTCIFPVDN